MFPRRNLNSSVDSDHDLPAEYKAPPIRPSGLKLRPDGRIGVSSPSGLKGLEEQQE